MASIGSLLLALMVCLNCSILQVKCFNPAEALGLYFLGHLYLPDNYSECEHPYLEIQDFSLKYPLFHCSKWSLSGFYNS